MYIFSLLYFFTISIQVFWWEDGKLFVLLPYSNIHCCFGWRNVVYIKPQTFYNVQKWLYSFKDCTKEECTYVSLASLLDIGLLDIVFLSCNQCHIRNSIISLTSMPIRHGHTELLMVALGILYTKSELNSYYTINYIICMGNGRQMFLFFVIQCSCYIIV